MRAVWVDAFGEGIRSPAEIDALVGFAVDAGLDALVVQVTRRGDTLAHALDLPRVAGVAGDVDPLAATCERAHAAGLAVHAWLAVTPAGQGGARPERVAPWLSRTADGAECDAHGIWHLDPALPAAQALVAEQAASVAARYPVAGVSLDRVRYPDPGPLGGARWGYHPDALARYAADTGTTQAPDPHDPAWQAWRRTQVTALVDDVVAAVRAVRTDVDVSINAGCFAGLEGGWEASRPYTALGQDWVGWLRDAVVDRVLAMNYRGDADDADLVDRPPEDADLRAEGAVAGWADPQRLRARFDDWARLAISAGGQRAVIGSGWYLHDVAWSATEAERAAALTADGRRGGGWCGFSYRTPSRRVLRGEAPATHERAALAAALRELD